MSEQVTPRLMAAAKEFNIGKETLTEFLISKGFDAKILKPTSKLTEEMYSALIMEFQSDKSVKKSSQSVELSQSSNVIISLKNEPSFKDKQQILKEPTVPKKEVAEHIRIKSPEIEGPNVIFKINLDEINSSTRPVKKKNEVVVETKEKEVKKEDTLIITPIKNQEVPKTEKIEADNNGEKKATTGDIKNNAELKINFQETRYTKIDGPKVLGKVDLTPKNYVSSSSTESDKNNKKRKRFTIDKKEASQNENKKIIPPSQSVYEKKSKNDAYNKPKQNFSVDKKIIDEHIIQEKIKETQAKLTDLNRTTKSIKSKYRKQKKGGSGSEEIAESGVSKIIKVTEFIPLREFASLLDINYTEIISKCLSLGLMVSINHRLDAEVMEIIASEYGFELQFLSSEIEMVEVEQDNESDLQTRPPIVTIMGHVDHGKTSLLDFIRKSNVVAGESGGITQKIGAYEVTTQSGKIITFIDTPGHEAFTAMRARGTKVTDIAVIVIAADDAVMPTTKEAISHAQAASIKMIFAFNKIDKEGASVDKIKEQLSQMNLLVEDWGGSYQCQEISAKNGTNVNILLEKINIEAELLDLKANPNRKAIGTVVDASLDKGRGYLASLLVQNGTLKIGDVIVSGQYYGRIKAMFNERNQKIQEAPPSTPVLILGLNGAPQAGDSFKVYESDVHAKEVANKKAQLSREQGLRTKKHITLDEIGRRLALGNFKELNVIIKADVDGSLEALSDALEKLSTQEVAVKIIHKGVGQITESDVMLAAASDAIIIAFQVRPSPQATKLAEVEAIQIKKYSVIYNVIEEIRSSLEGLLEPSIEETVNSNVEIRNIFTFDKAVIAGCYVTSGKLFKNNKVRIIRDGVVIFTSELSSLKRFKDDVKEVPSGMECGLTIKNFNNIKEGDIIEAFEQESVKRVL